MYLFFNPELIPTHRSPEPGCTCGYYAAKHPARLARAGRTASVIGTVSMWGRVIEHTNGWRARHMYPARLRLVCGRCLWLARLPAVPDRVLGVDDRLIPTCATHAGRVRGVDESLRVEPVQAELLDAYTVELLPVESLETGVEGADLITRVLRLLDLWSR
jgi:hypothetical protein